MCVSTVRARAGCAVFMALCLKTDRIVAVVSPGCKHNPGQRLCCLVISSTVVYLWVDERLGMLLPLKWFVRSWWEPIAGSSEPWKELPSCIPAITPVILGAWAILIPSYKTINSWSKKNWRKMEGTVLFPSGRKPGCTCSFKLWLSRGEEKVSGLITVLVCKKTNCALHEIPVQLRLFCSLKKWWISHCCLAGIF